MVDIPIGQKIKELRISKKMTQQDVVGNFITRNMLSKIENESASPSIKTLEYLAGALQVPVSFLLEGSNLDETALIKENAEGGNAVRILQTARNEYCNCHYDNCMDELLAAFGNDLSKTPRENQDEALILCAMAAYQKASEEYQAGNHITAVRHAGMSIDFNRRSLYYNQTYDAKCTLLINDSLLKK